MKHSNKLHDRNVKLLNAKVGDTPTNTVGDTPTVLVGPYRCFNGLSSAFPIA